MGAARETDQADFDLERFIDMFDTAMTSDDPRVVETLRKLMMIVALTAPESKEMHGRSSGPLRRMFDDMHNLNRRMHDMEDGIRSIQRERERSWAKDVYRADDHDKYTMAAAAQMAQTIDADVMRKVSADWVKQINGGTVSAVNIPAGIPGKGLIKK